jgi:hypothetical protein
MSLPSTSTAVRGWGCAALSTLSEGSLYSPHIVEAGGVGVVIGCMQSATASKEVQEHGCAVIGNLADDAVSRAAIAGAGGIDVVVAAMRRHATLMQLVFKSEAVVRCGDSLQTRRTGW